MGDYWATSEDLSRPAAYHEQWAYTSAPESRFEWVEAARGIKQVPPLHPSKFEQIMNRFGCVLHLVMYPMACLMMAAEVLFFSLPPVWCFTILIPIVNPLMTFLLVPDVLQLLCRPLFGDACIGIPGNSQFPVPFLLRVWPELGARVAYTLFGSAPDLTWAHGKAVDMLIAPTGCFPSGIFMDDKRASWCLGKENPQRARCMAEYLRIAFFCDMTIWDGPIEPQGHFSREQSKKWYDTATEYAKSGLAKSFERNDTKAAAMFCQAFAGWGKKGAECLFDACEKDRRTRTWLRERVFPTIAEDDRLKDYMERFIYGHEYRKATDQKASNKLWAPNRTNSM